MRVQNLYADANGESHWRDIEMEFEAQRASSRWSKMIPTTGVMFREAGSEHDSAWHPAPRRQYLINLDGSVELTASDGEARIIGPGEVVLLEDTAGKGHLSKAVRGNLRTAIYIALE